MGSNLYVQSFKLDSSMDTIIIVSIAQIVI